MGNEIDTERLQAELQLQWLEQRYAEAFVNLDDNGHWVREQPLTGERLRQRIDALNVPYTRMALWLGLSVDGLHKQMRGTRAVSAQTSLLFHSVEAILISSRRTLEFMGRDTDPRVWRQRFKELRRELAQQRRTLAVALSVSHRHRGGPPGARARPWAK